MAPTSKKLSIDWDQSEGEEEEEEAFCIAMSLLTEGVKFGVLKAVKDLQVFEIIKKRGPGAQLSASEIAAELPTDNPEAAAEALGRMLDLLVSHSVLTATPIIALPGATTVQRRYGLAPACRYLIPDDMGVFLGPSTGAAMYKRMIESSLFLKDAVLEGEVPFTKAYGMSYFEHFGKQTDCCEEFHKAMSNHSILIMRKLLKRYSGFKGIPTLVDVGGGNGATLNMILSEYPTIKGINFDQPLVVANAPSYPGVEHVGGDMFVDIPKGDAIFLKWICHNLNDEACLKVLKNCYAALPKDEGKVIICEGLLPNPLESTTNDIKAITILQLDMIMMATVGGKERTANEVQALAIAAGFQGFRVVCSAYDAKIMELLKKN